MLSNWTKRIRASLYTKFRPKTLKSDILLQIVVLIKKTQNYSKFLNNFKLWDKFSPIFNHLEIFLQMCHELFLFFWMIANDATLKN
jgi:hypothetical protein